VVSVALCSGQGSQKVGMGKDLADRFPAARDTFAAIDDALGFALSRIMWEGPEEELTLTHNAQPAILAHTCAVLAVVGPRLGTVVATAGHSLGEYSAWVVAGAISATDAACLVRLRGEAMLAAGKDRPGGMAAVLGLSAAEVAAACARSTDASGIVVPANLNAPDQTVISGDTPAVARATEACKSAGARRVLPLKVSGAFHSPLMQPAVEQLRFALEGMRFNPSRCPVIANATALPVRRADDARRLLAEQVVSPVRWVEGMQTCAADHPRARYYELGPGHVLSGLLKRIVPGKESTPLGTAAEVEKFLA
jgi:[acyl-carrier-protein] S-malonyltransferase